MENNSYKTLSAISVKEKVKKKGHLNYLPWSHAWHILKTHYPSAQRIVYESEHTGLNYFTDGVTAYVKVGLIVNGLEHIDYLPVMDNKNASIKLVDGRRKCVGADTRRSSKGKEAFET
jgi:hypothetical protein